MARAKQGDREAYGELVRRHQAAVFRAAFILLRNAAAAEDAAQEAFVRAYGGMRRFRDGAPFRPWVLEIVGNQARNQLRGDSRREALALRVSGDGLGHEESPEHSVVADERRRELLAALEGLRDEERVVVSCRYLLELSEAETAALLRCPPGTVKSRLSRALANLRLVVGERQAVEG